MEDVRKRSSETGEEEEREWLPAAKRPKEDQATAAAVADEDIMAWLSLDEEDEEDDRLILELLEAEKSCAAEAANKVRFSEDPYHRSSPASVFQTTPSSYVTINGNEESCGSSFSDWDSSVMASVDMAGFEAGSELFGIGFGAVGRSGAWGANAEEGCGGEWDDELGLDLNDDSLAGFLGEIVSSEQSLA